MKVIHLFILFQGNWTDEINQAICMAIKLSSRCMEIQLESVNRAALKCSVCIRIRFEESITGCKNFNPAFNYKGFHRRTLPVLILTLNAQFIFVHFCMQVIMSCGKELWMCW